mgnify:FL=1
MTQALELIEVSVDYHRGGQPVHALDSVSLAIGRSESVAVMGPSGCGKSTLLGVLALTIPPTSGSVLVSGVPAPSSPDGRARTRNHLLGLIPQSGAVIDHLSVLANVSLPLEYSRPRTRRRVRHERARQALADVGISWAEATTPPRLSGGERQRVAVARALVNRPRCILADEPTASLDSATALEVTSLLISQSTRDGGSLIIATHDPRVAEACDRVLTMQDGRITG